MNKVSKSLIWHYIAYSVPCVLSVHTHTPATLDSSRSSNSASWCNASADSWGAPGKHNRMMLMLSKLPCGAKWRKQRWIMMADLTNVNITNGKYWVNSFINRPFSPQCLGTGVTQTQWSRKILMNCGRSCDILRSLCRFELKLCYITEWNW